MSPRIPHVLKPLTRSFRRFAASRSGSALPLIAIATSGLVVATGAAVDMGRAQMVQARLSSSLDAAGLAAGASVSTTNTQDEVNKYFYVNYPVGYMGSTVTTLTATPTADKDKINLVAEATLPMTFMKVVGIQAVKLKATSEITRQNRGMELVMVLDVTGSMAGSKMTSLRAAAKELVKTLYGSKTTIPNLWIGMVPYVTTVNIGSQTNAQNWLTSYDLTQYPPNYPAAATKWKGCILERPDPNDTNDEVPVAGNSASALATRFPMWVYPDTPSSYGNDNNWIDDSTGAVTLNESANYSDSNAKGPNIACPEPVTAMTSSRAAIDAKIDQLNYWRRSGTASPVGLVWGWRMLSPGWRGQWDHELVDGQVALPRDYNTPLIDKVVVLMTDGVNEFYKGASSTPPYSDYTSYLRLNTTANGGRPDINTTNKSTALSKLNTKFANICNAMKDSSRNIIIYTVTFQLGNSTSHNESRTLFKNCATKPEYYFDAESQVPGAPQVNLTSAFQAIGDSLANLHVSQ